MYMDPIFGKSSQFTVIMCSVCRTRVWLDTLNTGIINVFDVLIRLCVYNNLGERERERERDRERERKKERDEVSAIAGVHYVSMYMAARHVATARK